MPRSLAFAEEAAPLAGAWEAACTLARPNSGRASESTFSNERTSADRLNERRNDRREENKLWYLPALARSVVSAECLRPRFRHLARRRPATERFRTVLYLNVSALGIFNACSRKSRGRSTCKSPAYRSRANPRERIQRVWP